MKNLIKPFLIIAYFAIIFVFKNPIPKEPPKIEKKTSLLVSVSQTPNVIQMANIASTTILVTTPKWSPTPGTVKPTSTPIPTKKIIPTTILTTAPLVGCSNYAGIINTASQKYAIRAKLLTAQLDQESGCDPLKDSGKGDFGIAQIHLSAHPDVTVDEAYDPTFAINWQSSKMSYYIATYGELEALRRYNCGDRLASDDPNCGIVYANNILSEAQ